MKTTSTENEVHDDLDYTDPSTKYKNLEFVESSHTQVEGADYAGPYEELCWSCGWNVRDQTFSSYGSRVRIMHTRANMGIWTIGTRWVLRDEPNNSDLGNNYMTLKFLHQQPDLTIPLPRETHRLSPATDPIIFTLESRVPGDTLASVWPTLSPEEKASYSRQLADALRQLRRFTAPRPQKVDGSQLDDYILARCRSLGFGNCFKIGYTVDEWLDSLGADLRMGLSRIHNTVDPAVIEEKFQEVKASFPDCEPYVLTHTDLNLSNIIVKDGKIQGIIDWEHAGYYPWWVERWNMGSHTDEMAELAGPIWKELMPDIDRKKWRELVYDKFFPADKAWGYSIHDHPGQSPTWFRPPFCECKPVRGEFRAYDWGKPYSCQLKTQSAEQDALMETYKRKDPRALRHDGDLDTPKDGGDECEDDDEMLGDSTLSRALGLWS